MDEDQDSEFLSAVRAVLTEAGFVGPAAGDEGVHMVRHARGVMVGRMSQQLPRVRVRARRRGPRRGRSGNG
ncbi:hypothetical protein ABTX85_08805 [Streptomyces sp. NPDC096097]|uniref:hypothetical protein n=1 Tax=Streptomyces sp. NPDC096097 TaxID=3155546 RepID=UPI003325D537